MGTEETFVDIKGYEGLYKISNHGRVLGVKRGYLLRASTRNNYGYLFITLCKDNISKSVYIHHLVLIHFIREPEKDEVCRHKDGNCKNNHVDNLEWGTQLENIKDKIKHGTCKRKLIEDDIVSIRKLYKDGKSQKEIAKIFNIDPSNISRIIRKEIWSHIS